MSLDTALRLPPDLKRSRLGRLLIPFALVAAAALLATGLRAGTGMFEAWQNQRAAAAAAPSTDFARSFVSGEVGAGIWVVGAGGAVIALAALAQVLASAPARR